MLDDSIVHKLEIVEREENTHGNTIRSHASGDDYDHLGAEVLDRLLDQSFEGNKTDVAADEAREKKEKLILDLAASLPPFKVGSLVTNELGSWVLDQAKKQALDQVKETIDGSGSAADNKTELTTYSRTMKENAMNMAVQAMHSSGFWDDDTVARTNEVGTTAAVVTAPPPEAFNDDGSLNVDSDAYKQWFQDRSGISSTVKSSIGDIYPEG